MFLLEKVLASLAEKSILNKVPKKKELYFFLDFILWSKNFNVELVFVPELNCSGLSNWLRSIEWCINTFFGYQLNVYQIKPFAKLKNKKNWLRQSHYISDQSY